MKVVVFRTVLQQTLGLRFRRPESDTAYCFPLTRSSRPKFSMWFVPEPIDIYFADQSGVVVDVHRGFQPFSAYRSRKKCSLVVETAPGLLYLEIGDSLPRKTFKKALSKE